MLENKDYGRGFYCTEEIELAKEWSCSKGIDGDATNMNWISRIKVLNLIFSNHSKYS